MRTLFIILLTLLAISVLIIACLGFSKNSDLAWSGSESYLNHSKGKNYLIELEKIPSNILLTLGKIPNGGKGWPQVEGEYEPILHRDDDALYNPVFNDATQLWKKIVQIPGTTDENAPCGGRRGVDIYLYKSKSLNKGYWFLRSIERETGTIQTLYKTNSDPTAGGGVWMVDPESESPASTVYNQTIILRSAQSCPSSHGKLDFCLKKSSNDLVEYQCKLKIRDAEDADGMYSRISTYDELDRGVDPPRRNFCDDNVNFENIFLWKGPRIPPPQSNEGTCITNYTNMYLYKSNNKWVISYYESGGFAGPSGLKPYLSGISRPKSPASMGYYVNTVSALGCPCLEAEWTLVSKSKKITVKIEIDNSPLLPSPAPLPPAPIPSPSNSYVPSECSTGEFSSSLCSFEITVANRPVFYHSGDLMMPIEGTYSFFFAGYSPGPPTCRAGVSWGEDYHHIWAKDGDNTIQIYHTHNLPDGGSGWVIIRLGAPPPGGGSQVLYTTTYSGPPAGKRKTIQGGKGEEVNYPPTNGQWNINHGALLVYADGSRCSCIQYWPSKVLKAMLRIDIFPKCFSPSSVPPKCPIRAPPLLYPYGITKANPPASIPRQWAPPPNSVPCSIKIKGPLTVEGTYKFLPPSDYQSVCPKCCPLIDSYGIWEYDAKPNKIQIFRCRSEAIWKIIQITDDCTSSAGFEVIYKSLSASTVGGYYPCANMLWRSVPNGIPTNMTITIVSNEL